MGHVTGRGYLSLQKRLDAVAQGAPASDSLFKILEVLFDSREAELAAKLPVNLFPSKRAAKIWKKDLQEAEAILEELADKGILLDFCKGDDKFYMLAPSMAGFIEFAIMRTDGKFDRKLLSELFHQYINKEEDFVREIFLLNPAIDRIFVQEDTISQKDQTEVLDYERASKVIEAASFITVSDCYCRHKKEHTGGACDNPQRVCLTFNRPAESLARHGISEPITQERAFEILHDCIDRGLVQLGDNIQEEVAWICNCCSCCCEGLNAYKRLGYHSKINSNFISVSTSKECTGCGICEKRCPVDAIKVYRSKNGKKYARVIQERCIGCGVCVRFCPEDSREMSRRKERMFVPKDTFERYILNAIEEGKLQNYVFDNFDLWTHELLRKFLGVFMRLSPVKKALASRQLQSKFLWFLTKTGKYENFNKIFYDGQGTDYSHLEMKA